MAIPNYIRPQLTIEQILQTTPTTSTDRISAVVIGRQYLLSQYGEQDNVYGVNFTTAGLTGATSGGIPLKYWDASIGSTGAFAALDSSGYTVSTVDVDLYVGSGEATAFSATATATLGRGYWTIKSADELNVLVLGSTMGTVSSSNTASIYSGFSNRPVATSDIFYVKGATSDSNYRRRTVTAVSEQEITLSGPAVSSSFTDGVNTTLQSSPGGTTNFKASSTAGLTANMPIVSIGGATAVFADYTYITAIAGATVSLNQAVTGSSGDIVNFGNIIADMQLAVPVSQVVPSTEWNFDSSDLQVTVSAAAEVDVAGRSSAACPLRDGIGKLYPSYKALKTVSATEGLITIESVSDIESNLGVINMDNEIAYGASEALSGSQGKTIYALRVAADTTTAYTTALKKIESTDSVYALAPLTDTLAVKEVVASHCESMSAKTIKNFRRCYVGTDSPGEYSVYTRVTGTTTKINLDITVSGGGIFADVTNDSSVDLRTLNLTEGDLIKVINSNGDYTGDEYILDEVTDANSVILSEGPASSESVLVEFWKADTPDSQIDYVIEQSQALGSRRAVNVWVENGTKQIGSVSTIIPNKYVACEVAGLRSALVPWQGLTMTEITAVTDAPSMYTRYNNTDLDRAASNGVFVITQEAETGSIFVRHQLTTQTAEGSLAYEDSVGVSLDSVSFQIKDALSGFIGRKNVTRQTINEIYDTCWDILNVATKTSFSSSAGPQLNGFQNAAGEDNKLDVKAHPTLKDRITVYAKLLMPLPLNNIDVVLDATVDFAL